METLHAFREVGYTLLAVLLPLVLLALLLWSQLEISVITRDDRRSAKEAGSLMGAVLVLGVSGISVIFLRLMQVILILLLALNVILATIPYGTSHGLW